MPNVGKSTLFNALARTAVAAENYPFCTVEPNTGMVPVPDPRLERLAGQVRPERTVPAQVRFVDIAGLVRGASAGEGLGNRFLAHVRETQAIVHVVRCFEDESVIRVEKRGNDPVSDYELVHTELCLADLETVGRAVARLRQPAASGDKAARRRLELLGPVREALERGRAARRAVVPAGGWEALSDLHLLTAKPTLIVANAGEAQAVGGASASLERLAREEEAGLLVVCARLEAEIARLPSGEQKEYLQAMGIEESGLARLVRAGYRLLGLHTFYTVDPREVRAWTIPIGASALEAAATIHTDFARGFVRAEVTRLDDYLDCGGEYQARATGKCRLEGKDYIVRDGDVIYFRCNP